MLCECLFVLIKFYYEIDPTLLGDFNLVVLTPVWFSYNIIFYQTPRLPTLFNERISL